jgi:hypothetical protein
MRHFQLSVNESRPKPVISFGLSQAALAIKTTLPTCPFTYRTRGKTQANLPGDRISPCATPRTQKARQADKPESPTTTGSGIGTVKPQATPKTGLTYLDSP